MGIFIGRALFILLIAGGVAAMVFTVFATQPETERGSAEPRPVAVFVEEALRENVTLSVISQGQVQPRTQINLVPQVAGRIVYVNENFIEGGFFEAGETLLRIESADYNLAVTRARATVAQRQQALVREQAESDLARAEWEELGEGQASTLTLREPQMAEARAQLAAAEATLQSAQLDLSRTRISAPFAGRVRSKNAGLGQYVSPGTPLGEVFSTDSVLVRLPLTDYDLGQLGIPVAYNATGSDDGIEVVLSAVLAGETREWPARITRTDSAIDAQTRVLYAIAEVEDPYGVAAENGAPLAVGLFVSAHIEGQAIDGAYVLPRSALRGEDTIYVAEEGGRLSVRTVDVINSTTERLLVAGGVDEGELVVVSPVRGASDNMRIQSLDSSGDVITAYSAIIEVPEEDDADDAEGLAENETAGSDGEAVASAN